MNMAEQLSRANQYIADAHYARNKEQHRAALAVYRALQEEAKLRASAEGLSVVQYLRKERDHA